MPAWTSRSSTRSSPDGFVVPDFQVASEFTRGEVSRWAPLVVEVAQTSQRRDREKAAVYATAGVPEHWLVDVLGEAVTVHRDPADGTYATRAEHRDGELRPLLPAPPLALDALFGR